jgi:hypothetical protein
MVRTGSTRAIENRVSSAPGSDRKYELVYIDTLGHMNIANFDAVVKYQKKRLVLVAVDKLSSGGCTRGKYYE